MNRNNSEEIKVVILNTSEQSGGAAIASNRLMKALRKTGINASMLVLKKQTNDEFVVSVQQNFMDKLRAKYYFLWERLCIFFQNGFSRKHLFQVSLANTGFDISKHPLVQSANIIHLHWINQGFLSLSGINKLLESGKPIVWTMHDMWPATGICHHAWNCKNYEQLCGNCFLLKSDKKKDLSDSILLKKQAIYSHDIRFIAVSSWLMKVSQAGSLMCNQNIDIIPNLIDTETFFPRKKEKARQFLSFPTEKKIVVMGAQYLDNPIKGLSSFLSALAIIAEKRSDLLIVLFGNYKGDKEQLILNSPFEMRYMGDINNPSFLAQLYSAADVTVMPSYYETFGQTLIESMACGCPVVSFDNSGQVDVVNHLKNGYLAKSGDIEDFAQGIIQILNEANHSSYCSNAIAKIKHCYTESIVSEQYISLYKSLLRTN